MHDLGDLLTIIDTDSSGTLDRHSIEYNKGLEGFGFRLRLG